MTRTYQLDSQPARGGPDSTETVTRRTRRVLHACLVGGVLAGAAGCAGIGIGVPVAPGISVGLGVGHGGVTAGVGTGVGPVGVGVGVNQGGQVVGGAGVGASVPVGGARVGAGIGTGTVLREPRGGNRVAPRQPDASVAPITD